MAAGGSVLNVGRGKLVSMYRGEEYGWKKFGIDLGIGAAGGFLLGAGKYGLMKTSPKFANWVGAVQAEWYRGGALVAGVSSKTGNLAYNVGAYTLLAAAGGALSRGVDSDPDTKPFSTYMIMDAAIGLAGGYAVTNLPHWAKVAAYGDETKIVSQRG